MNERPLRLLVLGAHPDDADLSAGGLAAIYTALGHQVKLVSLTNGESGHHEQHGPVMAQRRRAEAARAGKVIGAEYVTWDNRDGYLEPTLDLRFQIIREIRTFQPDLVLTHRPNDYHPDHRAVGSAVCDASYMVTVPAIVPDVPCLRRDPVVAFMSDYFQKPTPLKADVAIDVTDQIERVVDMLACHESQVFEWLAYHDHLLDQVPADDAGRRKWLRGWYTARIRRRAEQHREALIRTYGPTHGSAVEFCEAYEISEYAAPLDLPTRARLFPFLPRWS